MDAKFLKEHELEVKRLTTWRWAVDTATEKLYYYDIKSKKTAWSTPKVQSVATP
jgi:hypothetical protein